MPFRARAVLGLEAEQQQRARRAISGASMQRRPRQAIRDAVLAQGRAARLVGMVDARTQTIAELAPSLGPRWRELYNVLETPRSEKHIKRAASRLARQYERSLPEGRDFALRRVESDIDRIVATELWQQVNATREGLVRYAERVGVQVERIWDAELDTRTCSICAARDGKVTRDVPPAHILCRCFVRLRVTRALFTEDAEDALRTFAAARQRLAKTLPMLPTPEVLMGNVQRARARLARTTARRT